MMMGMVMIVCERVTQHTCRRDANGCSTGIHRLNRAPVGIVSGHAAHPSKSANDGNDKGSGKLTDTQVYHSSMETKDHK